MKKYSKFCGQLVRGKLNWEDSCLCPSSCKLEQLQNKPADPCAEKRLWACVDPESTWPDACGQEMELLGLSVLGLCDRHGLCCPPVSGFQLWAPLPGVPTVSLLVFWGCPCGTQCTSSWNRWELGVGVTRTTEHLIFSEPGHCLPLYLPHSVSGVLCSPLAERIRWAIVRGFSSDWTLVLIQAHASPSSCQHSSACSRERSRAGAAHMALIPAGYCCRVRNVARWPAKVQLPCTS